MIDDTVHDWRIDPWMDGLPMQPVELAADGVVRFRANRIVKACYEAARNGERLDLNDVGWMACDGKFTAAEQMQFAQLIGYSVSGFGDLPYASESAVCAADEMASHITPEVG